MKNQVKVSDFIAKFLSKKTKHVFVGQGGSVVHLLDSINKTKDLKNISSQNEQGSAIAADAYARISGKIGVAIATSGPGIINLLQGIGCAYYDSTPTFFISGAVTTSAMKDRKIIRQAGFQQMDVVKMLGPITKYVKLITDCNEIKYELEKCVYIAKSGRPGPVLLDIPDDIQRAYINPKKIRSFVPLKIKNTLVDRNKKFKSLKNLILKSLRPLVIVGNGVNLSNTKGEVLRFLRKSKIPFCPTWATVDIFSDYKLKDQNVGIFGVAATRYGNFTVQNSDLIICLGTRLNTQLTGSIPSSFAPKAKRVVIDIDQAEFKKTNNLKIDLKFNCDLKFFMPLLNKISMKDFSVSQDWKKKINFWKKKYPIIKDEYYSQTNYVNPYIFMNKLSEKTLNNDIIIPDASANLIWTYQGYEFKKKQRMFTALNHSPMGYSVAAAIGANLADIKSNVIAIIGDGSLPMNIQELQTIYDLNLPIKIFVINNNGYGLIKQTQETWLKANYVGVDPGSGLGLPDFKKVAKSYGIKSIKINNRNDLDKKLDLVLNSKKTILCELMVDPFQRVIPKLEFGKSIDELSPLLSKEENLKNRL